MWFCLLVDPILAIPSLCFNGFIGQLVPLSFILSTLFWCFFCFGCCALSGFLELGFSMPPPFIIQLFCSFLPLLVFLLCIWVLLLPCTEQKPVASRLILILALRCDAKEMCLCLTRELQAALRRRSGSSRSLFPAEDQRINKADQPKQPDELSDI